MFAPDGDITHFDAECPGKGTDGGEDIPDGAGDDSRISGHHQDSHGLANRTADPQNDRCCNARERTRDNDPADRLPAGRPDCKGALAVFTGN